MVRSLRQATASPDIQGNVRGEKIDQPAYRIVLRTSTWLSDINGEILYGGRS
jgi:hypothetical protein